MLAGDTSEINSGAGGLGIGLGSGAAAALSIGVNDIHNTVAAYISNATVLANGVSSSVDIGATERASDIHVVVGAAGSADGIALSGSVAVNFISDTVDARIENSAAVTATDNVSVSALDTASIATLAGDVSISINGPVAVGLAFAVNDVSDTVNAIIDASAVPATRGDISVTASFAAPTDLPPGLDVQIAAMAVSGAGTTGTFAGAGSVALNWIKNNVTASVENLGATQTVTAGGNLNISASDHSTIDSLAGAVAIAGLGSAAGAGAIGFSISYNYLGGDPNHPGSSNTNNVTASINNDAGTISAADINVSATYGGAINNVTIAGAAAAGTGVALTLGGAVSINRINNNTNATITGSKSVSATGSGATDTGVQLNAQDDAIIEALAGGVGISISKGSGVGLAAGVSVADNEIGDSTTASINGSTINSSAGVGLLSNSTATIEALTIGVAVAATTGGGGAGAGAGAGSGNTVSDSVTATIVNSSSVTTTAGAITLEADDTPTIEAASGALSFAGAFGASGVAGSIGVSASNNEISDTDEAYVDTSKISSAGALDITADENATIDAWAIGGSIGVATGATGGALSIAVTEAVNHITDTVKSYVNASSSTVAAGDIDITALQDGTIEAYSIAASVSVAASSASGIALSGGGAESRNVIIDTTDAYVAGSTISSTVGNLNVSANAGASIDAQVFALAASVAVGGYDGGAIAIGASLARNAVGYDINAGTGVVSSTPSAGSEVRAYITDSKATAANINVSAVGTETISATVVAAAVAVAVSGGGALGGAGAGSSANNKVAVTVEAGIYNDATGTAAETVSAGSVSVVASDTPTIHATVASAALGVAFGTTAAGAVSIAVSLASNTINDTVDADIHGETSLKATAASTATNNGLIISATSAADILASATSASLSISGAGADSRLQAAAPKPTTPSPAPRWPTSPAAP